MSTEMREQLHTPSRIAFRIPNPDCTPSSEEIIVRVSQLPLTRVSTIQNKWFSTLVLINQPSSSAAQIILPDGSEITGLREPGSACLLPPGTIVMPRDSSQAQLIRYDTPVSSFRAFAERFGMDKKPPLRSIGFATDPFLRVLSRTVQPLLERSAPRTNEFGEFFTLSFYRHLLEQYELTSPAQARFVGGLSPCHKRLVEDALRTATETPISIEVLASRCGFSSRHLARAFRQSFGVSFHRHLLNLRLLKAKSLLVETDLTLKEIGVEIGYADQATFTESFTKLVGSSPGRYRRQFRPECDPSRTAN